MTCFRTLGALLLGACSIGFSSGCCCLCDGGGCGGGGAGCGAGGYATGGGHGSPADFGWQDGGGSFGHGSGCCGSGCGSGCGMGCSTWAAAGGWCPDYPAMAAGWTPCNGPIIAFFGGLRNAFASGGCCGMFAGSCGCDGGCGDVYWGEWRSDPPACHDPCPDAYGPGCGSCGASAGSGWTDGGGSMVSGDSCNCAGKSRSGPGHYVAKKRLGGPVAARPAPKSQRSQVRSVSHDEPRKPKRARKHNPIRRSSWRESDQGEWVEQESWD